MWHGQVERGPVPALAFGADSRTLYTADASRAVRAWDVGTQQGRELFRLAGPAKRVTFALKPDGSDLLVHTPAATCWVWDVAAGRLVYPGNRAIDPAGSFGYDARPTLAAAYDAAGAALYFLSSPPFGLARIPSAGGPRELPRALAQHARNPTHLAGSPDGRRLAVAAERGVVIWDTLSNEVVAQIRLAAGTAVSQIALGDSGTLAVALADELRLHDAESGRLTATVPTPRRPVLTLALQPHGRRVFSADGTSAVSAWDANTGEPLGAFDWSVGKVRSLAVAPDGLVAAAGGTTRRFAVFDVDE